jgi:cation:H+ antiporter
MPSVIAFVFSLVFIVIVSQLFCNALEHLGAHLGFSDGVTGSVFAAVATAMPETIIPILAVLNFRADEASKDIGVGAILGAPLMLSTLSLFVMAFSVIKKRGLNGKLKPELSGLKRDLRFFVFSYLLSLSAILTGNLLWHNFINRIIAIVLLLNYLAYLFLTIKSSKQQVLEGHGTSAEGPLFLQRLGFKVNIYVIVVQLLVAAIMLVYFADLFIDAVSETALLYKVPPFLLSLIIVPIATELPEKINSILWLHKGKDTLAFGNITGAMVFQGSLLPIIGILFTNWSIAGSVQPIIGIVTTLIASSWLYLHAVRGNLRVWHFAFNGMLYVANLWLCIYWAS